MPCRPLIPFEPFYPDTRIWGTYPHRDQTPAIHQQTYSMPKTGATSINMKIVATAGKGGGGKSQQHNLRALGLGHEEIEIVKSDGSTALSSHHILEDLMLKHFAGKDMAALSPEDRRAVNAEFVADVHDAMASRGLTNKSDDPEDKRVMDHVDPKLTPLNDFVILQPLEHYLDNTLRPLVKELTGQKMQDKCTPFKEGVAVIKEDTTIEELLDYGKKVEKEIGWHLVQVYIHKDEGHKDKQTQEWKENRHAHLVFDTIDHNTGKTIQVNRLDLANMQTLLSQSIHMDRGENSSDLAHLNSLEFKADMELANSRLELSLSVAKLGKDPRQILADVVSSAIDAKLTDKPNDRTTLNLLRVVGKDLFVNPTKLCADAIFKELKNQPDKINDIVDILKIDPQKLKNLSPEAVLDTVHDVLLEKAVRCGKTESAKEFRPLLNSAKELGLDLTPVMLNPIRERIAVILESPIDRENNHALFRCADRCKVNPNEILQNVLSQGMAEKDVQISEKDQEIAEKDVLISKKDQEIAEKDDLISKKSQEIDEKNDVIYSQSMEIASLRDLLKDMSDQLNYVSGKKDEVVKELGVAIQDKQTAVKDKDAAIQIKDDVISKTLFSTGSSVPDAICKELHSLVKAKLDDPSSITKEGDVTKMAQACSMLDLKPNGIMTKHILAFANMKPENESLVCRSFSIDKADGLNILCEQADNNKVLDKKIIYTYPESYTFETLSNVFLKKVDELAVSAKESPADMQKLKDIASHFDIDLLSVSKKMADDFSKGVVAQKEESDILVKKIETQTAELDTVVSKVTKMSTELDSVTADVKTNKEKLADLRSMIAGSESTVKNIAGGVKDKLFKSNNDYKILYTSLQSDFGKLESKVEHIKEEGKANQKKALDSLRDLHYKETDNLQKEIRNLNQTVKSQTSQITQLNEDKSKLESKISSLKQVADSLRVLIDPAKRLLLDIGYAANQVVSLFKGEKIKLLDGQKLNWEGHGKYTANSGDTSHFEKNEDGKDYIFINDKTFDRACKEQAQEQEHSQQIKRRGPRL